MGTGKDTGSLLSKIITLAVPESTRVDAQQPTGRLLQQLSIYCCKFQARGNGILNQDGARHGKKQADSVFMDTEQTRVSDGLDCRGCFKHSTGFWPAKLAMQRGPFTGKEKPKDRIWK